jgi:hypothetical protein
LANVRDHRRRTAGATDAGEERASASGVTAGRCSVDRFVRIYLSCLKYGWSLNFNIMIGEAISRAPMMKERINVEVEST